VNSLTPSKAFTYSFFLADETATKDFAVKMAKHCYPGLIIYLQGQLGAGKTSFARAFLQGLGYPGRIKSPTFTLVEPYIITSKKTPESEAGQNQTRNFMVYHFDFYRLMDPKELYYLGLDDYINHESICLIEWPEKAGALLPPAHLLIRLSISENINSRNLKLIISDPYLASVLQPVLGTSSS
jgi:tRNA threonylcarbamoyladenosine biosynthesis protein TsaE